MYNIKFIQYITLKHTEYEVYMEITVDFMYTVKCWKLGFVLG